MPGGILAGLIAHELAHTLQYIRLGCFMLPDDPMSEIEANALALAWGFEGRDEIEAWFHEARNNLDRQPSIS